MNREKMRRRYRRFPWLSDIGGIKSAIGELRGIGHPEQPKLRKSSASRYDIRVTEDWFIDAISSRVAHHVENRMEYPFFGERIFDEPLVGFVRGNDPLLLEYKEIIGPHHFTPEEIMAWQAKRNGVPAPAAEELSVVSFVLPISAKTKEDNAASTKWPAERWAQTRMSGEMFSQLIVREIVTNLMKRGILAVAPDVTPMFNKKRYPKAGWASPWSHRHMAYAAGLGTFGMQDFLITPKGAAHRCGSFVVHRRLTPNRKRPDDIHAWCLHYQGKECLKCAGRCPVGAITREHAHDKEACYRHVAQSTRHCLKNYRLFIYGCGLCSTGVPCESRIPAGLRK
ncbi:MAG: epoxyqueuosine reductase [Spirochaetes bacterium]|nr:epoxyqueuosine reductase [Spirochaetota bacterium]